MRLDDGSRVAVVGGGPAGSLPAFFLLDLADRAGIDVQVDIYEPKDFSALGPGGCNNCGGIVSESLVQMLATEGINLPPSVVQRGLESYVLHADLGTVSIASARVHKDPSIAFRILQMMAERIRHLNDEVVEFRGRTS